MQKVKVKDFFIGEDEPLAICCGPCVIESEEMILDAAYTLKEMFDQTNFSWIFKSSFDKANRSSVNSFRGPGIDKGLKILQKVKEELDVPILTDIHSPKEAKIAAQVCDIIQIPAFLCRQTDLILAAANTGCVVNIKKGQFMAPFDMKNSIDKVLSTKNNQIIVTDRGTSFGYNQLISDMRAIPIMQKFGFPVCFDATHSVQTPGGLGNISGGDAEFIPHLAKAAVAVGANMLYIEAHKAPITAKSDAKAMISFENLKVLLKELEILYNATKLTLTK